MSEFIKTITANFETVDLAELAARNVKQNFSQVKAITIKYKNIPAPDYTPATSEVEESASNLTFLTGTGMSAGVGSGFAGVLPGFYPVAGTVFVGNRDRNHDHNTPECDLTTESRLMIKASESQVKQIEDHLRSVGGQRITIS